MRDLNSLYSEFLVTTTIRERQQQARQHDRLAEARAPQGSMLQRLIRAIPILRQGRTMPVSETAPLMKPERGTAS